MFREREIARTGVEKAHPEETNKSRRTQEESSSAFTCSLTHFIDIRAHLGGKMVYLERTVQIHELVSSQRTASQKEDSLNETITSPLGDLHMQRTNSGAFVDTMPHISLTRFLLSTSIEQKN